MAGAEASCLCDTPMTKSVLFLATAAAAAAVAALVRRLFQLEALLRQQQHRLSLIEVSRPVPSSLIPRGGTPLPPVLRGPGPPPAPCGGSTAVSAKEAMDAANKADPTSEACEGALSALPAEALQRIFELLPTAGQLACERVCHEWRDAVADSPIWREWCQRMATVGEAKLALPGTVATDFRSEPTFITPELAAAARTASEQVEQLPAEQLQLGLCGSHWTCFSMANAAPRALIQHCCSDFQLTMCPSAELLVSGDKAALLSRDDLQRSSLRDHP